MRLASRRKSVMGGAGLANIDDNDLVKALAGVPPTKLANMDEAFLLLDGGLGAVFSASMARRAAVRRGVRWNTSLVASTHGSITTPHSPEVLASLGAAREPSKSRGIMALKDVVQQFSRPKRILAAQRATLEITLPQYQDALDAHDVNDGRRGSPLTLPKGTLPPAPGNELLANELPPDPEVEAWAESALGLSPERQKDRESQELMRQHLGHQLLCWRALRAEKLPLPREAGAAGEAVQALDPAMLAAQALHSLPPKPRPPPPLTPRAPGARRPLVQRQRSVPPVWPPVPLRGSEGGGGSSPSSARRSRATASLRPPRPAPAVARDLPDAALPGPLPKPQTFLEPHREVASTALTGTPEFAYLRRCELRGLVPCETAWRGFGQGAGVVDVPKRTLGDKEIGAIVETAVHCAAKGHVLQVLDLGGNALSNEGLRGMAELLAKHTEACHGLTRLSLAGNTPLRLHCDSVLGELKRVFAALPSLTSLDLSGVRIHGQAATKLADALEVCSSLRSLSLVGCGLGQFQESECVAIASLFRHPDLESVDLSGNFFGCAGFAAAGAALRESKLKKLSFAGNSSMLGSTARANPGAAQSAGSGGREREERSWFHPLQLLVEGFQASATLRDIDLSGCGMGPDTAFVLEDALRFHPSVTSLSLADNPLGDAGLRCVIRLLIDSDSKVSSCHVEGHREADNSARALKFRPVQPGGMYRLNMRYPHERATLRTLLWLGEKTRGFALRPFRFDPKMPKPDLDEDVDNKKFWVVPTEGTFNFTYTLPLSKVAHQLLTQAMMRQATARFSYSSSSDDEGSVRNKFLNVKRSSSIQPFRFGNSGPLYTQQNAYDGQPPSSLLAPRDRPDPRPPHEPTPLQQAMSEGPQMASALECSWVEVAKLLQDARTQVCSIRFPLIRNMFLSLATEDEQLRFVRALAKDMSFNAAQVSKLCEDRPEIAIQTAVSLFPAINGRASQLLLLSGSSAKRAKAVSKAAGSLMWFQEGNVTGRYHLDLTESADYAVAERVLLVNAWETEVSRLVGRPDVSQRGNYEMLRNETLNDEPFTYGRDWGLPSHGWLFFDYSSIRRPPSTTGAMPEMNEVPKYLRVADIMDCSKLKALRAVSVHMYMTTQQFKNILNCFPEGSEDRQELFCMLHTRVVDPSRLLGPEVLRSPTLLRDIDRQALLKRIGHLHLLNPLHPEDVTYLCSLQVFEERMIVDFLVQLAVKEPGGRVVGTAVGANGRAALPVSWAENGVPDEEIDFCCTYETKTANLPWRQTLAARYSVGFSTVGSGSPTGQNAEGS